jgi:hypothetical protein
MGPPRAQKLPLVQAAPLPHWHVFVAGLHHSPVLQQPLPHAGPLTQAPPPAVQSC